MTGPKRDNKGEFITLGDALKSAIKQGLIFNPEITQDNQQNTNKEASPNGKN